MSGKNQNDLAMADFNKAIEQIPEYPEAYYDRGLLYLTLQKNDLAIADFKKVVALYKAPNAYEPSLLLQAQGQLNKPGVK